MIVERNPPVSREELNETQLQMLKSCDIPGLLPLETEECDGLLSLRYSLSGTRMLSEAMRTSNWSMTDMMGALCRLAEALEECRLYLLDADRIRLHDEFIFVGEDWQDLRFTYIPIDMPTLHRADDLERLIIRWMMKVKELDGQVMQNVLRLVAAAGFTPIVLSRYARQYLAGSVSGVKLIPSNPPATPLSAMPAEPAQATAKPSRSWDILRPASGDLHSISEMLGDVPEARGNGSHAREIAQTNSNSDDDSININRWRIVVVCIGFFLVAIVWRFIYLNEPSEQRILFCLCLTLVAGAGVLFLWNGKPHWSKKGYRTDVYNNAQRYERVINPERDCEGNDSDRWQFPRFPMSFSPQSTETPAVVSYLHSPEVDHKHNAVAETSWISAPNDQTALLDHNQNPRVEDYYLVWETKDAGERISLLGNSLVIGRSIEVAQHVDETMGISRAHAELVRVAEHWKVKDLGSRNGSRLNDKPMAPYELYVLHTGDCLTLANSQYRFQQKSPSG